MSKPRYKWWSYIKAVIRDYPRLREKYSDLHSQSLCVAYDGMPRGTEPSRTTEVIAVRELPTTEQREYEAVRRAVEETEQYNGARDRLRMIKLVYWDKTHTLEGAACAISCSPATVVRYNGAFLRLVAVNCSLLERSDYNNYYVASQRFLGRAQQNQSSVTKKSGKKSG